MHLLQFGGATIVLKYIIRAFADSERISFSRTRIRRMATFARGTGVDCDGRLARLAIAAPRGVEILSPLDVPWNCSVLVPRSQPRRSRWHGDVGATKAASGMFVPGCGLAGSGQSPCARPAVVVRRHETQ